MAKRTPHCQLAVVKAMVAAGKVRATVSALALTLKDFYKSLTAHADHRVWQDVYRPKTAAGEVYLKLTVIGDVLIVSFREL